MAKLLFIVLAVLEVAVTAVTLLKQRSNREWIRNRLAANGFELLLFISMALLPGIDFGFRFKGLFFLLILRLIFAGIRFLLKYKKAEGSKNKVVLIAGTVFMIILLFFSMVPAFVFADYQGKGVSGSYETAMKHVILIDGNREETFEKDGSMREVPIYIYYPVNAGEGETYPLVLFSHGSFGYYQSNTSTYMELASNGYVVISMEHPYHSIFTKDTNGNTIIADRKFLADAMGINDSSVPKDELPAITGAWMKLRIDDMNFVIDTVKTACDRKAISSDTWYLCDAENAGVPTEAEIIDILSHINYGKIGLMGHSLGGATATSVGRMRDDISAVIDLDGTMLGEEMGYENGSYIVNQVPYPIPLLSFDNESHFQDGIRQGSYYVNNIVIKNAVDAQHCYIAGSAHMNFTDLPLFSPALASLLGTGTIEADHCVDIVNEVVLKFMDSNLKGDGSYRVEEFYE